MTTKLVDTANALDKTCKPFLRWVGGKTWLLKELDFFLPKTYNNYYEPFLGGASVFFNLQQPNNSYLSDLNEELVNTYNQLRDNPHLVIAYLKQFKNTEVDYYKIRNQVFRQEAKRAAQFIFLNKTSFNGIYRVNSSGKYNVPYGFIKNYIVRDDLLLLSSEKLKKAVVTYGDFAENLTDSVKGDFAFIDPPYTVAHEKNGFISYNQKMFSLQDQERLADVAKVLDRRGVFFVLTNASHKAIKEIYKGVGSFYKVSRPSLIGGRGANRGIVNELIITNTK